MQSLHMQYAVKTRSHETTIHMRQYRSTSAHSSMKTNHQTHPFSRHVLLIEVWQVEVVKHCHWEHDVNAHLDNSNRPQTETTTLPNVHYIKLHCTYPDMTKY